MSRKRTKKQQKQLEELIKGFLVMFALSTYLFTKSFLATGILTFVVLGVFIGIAMIRNSKRKEKLRRSGIDEIDKMDGIQFEHYLAELFKKQGYRVEVTRSFGDYGADLVLKKENHRIVVQAKRYKSNVGVKAVQEVKSAVSHYDANEAWVVTNSGFTKQAYTLAQSNNVRLFDRDDLINMIIELNPRAS
ncbi:restriction endonuclease [Bacillus sp. 31A1R]|uniref:Restriction endonuclease n=1 Tax=Robertmurraya mangrovi TaxID=3098077 RepID=A0ABU5IXJ1_9BACI|nr:restriction endonuclease [Bacillus sp. 31A1R]MDZ5471878.1 restriction endonuclease [Bacillus sp. 31A1R]